MPSVLWRCWLGGRKGIRPVIKLNGGVLAWLSCLERGADLHMAHLMPLPLTVSCFSKIQIGFTFLVPAYLGSPGKGPLNVCVICFLLFIATARILCAAGSMKWYGVRLSDCPKYTAAGLLLWARWAGDISTSCCCSSVRQANVGSATLSAYVSSWTQTC